MGMRILDHMRGGNQRAVVEGRKAAGGAECAAASASDFQFHDRAARLVDLIHVVHKPGCRSEGQDQPKRDQRKKRFFIGLPPGKTAICP